MPHSKLLFISLLLFTAQVFAQDSNSKISGLVYADYFYVLQHRDAELENNNGFIFRRIYFTYDHNLSGNLTTRLRLEMKHNGDLKSKSSMEPFVKDAYLKWSMENHDLTFGISPTPTFKLISKYWGYRAVEKSLPNLQKFGSSRGLGISAEGNLAGSLKYHAMFANGTGGKSDNDEGKKIMLSLSTSPADNFTFEIYGDWNDFPGAEDWYTMQAFVGMDFSPATFGIHFTRQIRQRDAEDDLTINALSAFGRTKLTDKVKIFLRGDFMLDPNPLGDEIDYLPFAPNAKSTFILAGLEFIPAKNVSVIPNIQAIFYNSDDPEIDLDNDIIPRITLYYIF